MHVPHTGGAHRARSQISSPATPLSGQAFKCTTMCRLCNRSLLMQCGKSCNWACSFTVSSWPPVDLVNYSTSHTEKWPVKMCKRKRHIEILDRGCIEIFFLDARVTFGYVNGACTHWHWQGWRLRTKRVL